MWRKLSTFTVPSQGLRACPDSFLFFNAVARLHGDFVALLEVLGLMPAFSRCSVKIIASEDVFLIYLWNKVNSVSYFLAILIHFLCHILDSAYE